MIIRLLLDYIVLVALIKGDYSTISFGRVNKNNSAKTISNIRVLADLFF